MRIVVTRPLADAAPLAAQLQAAGHTAVLAPLLEVAFLPPPPLPEPPAGCRPLPDAVLVTSRHAVSALARHPRAAELRPIKLYAVGDATAAAARAAGWTEVRATGETADQLISAVADAYGGLEQPRWMLYAQAAEVSTDVVGNLAGLRVLARAMTVYMTQPVQALPDAVREGLRAGTVDGILLMSAKTARTWCALLAEEFDADAARQARGVIHYCLSPAVAEALGDLKPHRILVAERPDLEHILRLVKRNAAELG